jgi:hypothetical protein
VATDPEFRATMLHGRKVGLDLEQRSEGSVTLLGERGGGRSSFHSFAG